MGNPAARPGLGSGGHKGSKSGAEGVSEMGLRNVWMGRGGGESLTLRSSGCEAEGSACLALRMQESRWYGT